MQSAARRAREHRGCGAGRAHPLARRRVRRVGRYSVDVENFESIHNHSAYARIGRI